MPETNQSTDGLDADLLRSRPIVRRTLSVFFKQIIGVLVVGLSLVAAIEVWFLVLWTPIAHAGWLSEAWAPMSAEVAKAFGWDWKQHPLTFYEWLPFSVLLLGIMSSAVYVLCLITHQVQSGQIPDVRHLVEQAWRRRDRPRAKRFRNTYFVVTILMNLLIVGALVVLVRYIASLMALVAVLVVLVLSVLAAPVMFVAVPAAAIEQLSLISSVRRSRELTAGKRLRIMWLMAVVGGMAGIFHAAVVLLAIVLAIGVDSVVPIGEVAGSRIHYSFGLVGQAMLAALSFIAATTVYRELCTRTLASTRDDSVVPYAPV